MKVGTLTSSKSMMTAYQTGMIVENSKEVFFRQLLLKHFPAPAYFA